MSAPIRVALVDDHKMFREGIRQRLEAEKRFEIIGEAATAEQATALIEEKQPEILILDIRLPGKSGIEFAKTIRRRWPNVKILVVSGYDYDQYVRALARIGVSGYLLKEDSQDAVADALVAIAEGGAVFPPKIATKLILDLSGDAGRHRRTWELTTRELEVLEHLCEGLRNAQIAKRLRISTRTVETHVRHIISKLGVHSRSEALRKAIDEGLIR